jgi:hypothetical protein
MFSKVDEKNNIITVVASEMITVTLKN